MTVLPPTCNVLGQPYAWLSRIQHAARPGPDLHTNAAMPTTESRCVIHTVPADRPVSQSILLRAGSGPSRLGTYPRYQVGPAELLPNLLNPLAFNVSDSFSLFVRLRPTIEYGPELPTDCAGPSLIAPARPNPASDSRA
jgi:hypothetical protein